MATRLARRHIEKARKAIQVNQLVKRLCENAISEEEFMTANQIRCAEILLRKTLPDVSPVTVEGRDANTGNVVVVFGAPDQKQLPPIEGEVVE